MLSIMHLIATTGWPPEQIDGMPADDLVFWCGLATDYHNHPNRAPA
ncbi:MAG: hypothetical protein KBE71_04430 [Laribacter sp.]|nr:hypothetical protein [Laribacter sp.]